MSFWFSFLKHARVLYLFLAVIHLQKLFPYTLFVVKSSFLMRKKDECGTKKHRNFIHNKTLYREIVNENETERNVAHSVVLLL